MIQVFAFCAMFMLGMLFIYWAIFMYAVIVSAFKSKPRYATTMMNRHAPDDYWDGEPMGYVQLRTGEVRLDNWR